VWWRIAIYLVVVPFGTAIILGQPIDRAFIGGLLGGSVALMVLFICKPWIDRACAAEDRMWRWLWHRLTAPWAHQ
jgi:hypothetical protein